MKSSIKSSNSVHGIIFFYFQPLSVVHSPILMPIHLGKSAAAQPRTVPLFFSHIQDFAVLHQVLLVHHHRARTMVSSVLMYLSHLRCTV